MAGSLRTFLYTSDSGTLYYMLADESNCVAVGNPILNDPSLNKVPGNITKRFAKYISADRLSVINIPVSSVALFNALPPQVTNYRGVICFLSGGRSERRRIPALADTGIDTP